MLRRSIRVGVPLGVALAAGLLVLLGLAPAWLGHHETRADGAKAESKVVRLGPRMKLETVSWLCWSDAPCEPWHLARPFRQGETPETHTFCNKAKDCTTYLESP